MQKSTYIKGNTQALTKKTENNVDRIEHDAIYELHEYNPMNIMQYI